jgi:hypothetical protein
MENFMYPVISPLLHLFQQSRVPERIQVSRGYEELKKESVSTNKLPWWGDTPPHLHKSSLLVLFVVFVCDAYAYWRKWKER